HDSAESGGPRQAGLVLVSLILVAAVANLNLSVANVALPSIGKHFDSGQTTLDLIAIGYSLGLACSVLWLGAVGDRYGRKLLLLLGTALAIPMSLLAAFAPSDTVLFVARVGGGLSAGMALEHFYGGSVFLLTLPLAVVALCLAWRYVPAHVNETTEPVDNVGGLLSLVLVGTLIIAINVAPVPNEGTLTLVLTAIAVLALGL